MSRTREPCSLCTGQHHTCGTSLQQLVPAIAEHVARELSFCQDSLTNRLHLQVDLVTQLCHTGTRLVDTAQQGNDNGVHQLVQ